MPTKNTDILGLCPVSHNKALGMQDFTTPHVSPVDGIYDWARKLAVEANLSQEKLGLLQQGGFWYLGDCFYHWTFSCF